MLASTTYRTAQHECALRSIDLDLRSGDPSAAQKRLKALAKIRLEEIDRELPRNATLRKVLLEARLGLIRLASSRAVGAVPVELRDLLAHAGAHPRLDQRAPLRAELEALRASLFTWQGEFASARKSATSARAAERRSATTGLTSPARRRSRPDTWARLGLSALAPPLERTNLDAVEATAAAKIAGFLANEPRLELALENALETLATHLGGSTARVDILGEGKASRLLTRWRSKSSKASQKHSLERRVTAPLRARGATLGWLQLALPEDRKLDGSECALVEDVARRLAAHCSPVIASVEDLATSGAAKGDARPIQPLTRDHAATASLERTRALEQLARRQDEIATASLGSDRWHEDFVAESPSMKQLLVQIGRLARSDLPVLIVGESGTGKDHVARLLHRAGPRASFPFVVQSCGAIPADLFEADLFGFRQGAFSGADQTRTGFLFQAQGGTFHLESVGELDPAIQQRLLRIIESRNVRPLGSTRSVDLDVRFVASSGPNVDSLVENGEFREDLFFRLGGARLEVPPLRDRLEDLPHLVDLFASRVPEGPISVSKSAVDRLLEHSWPGNVRELVMLLRRLAIECDADEITWDDIERALGHATKEELFPAHLFKRHGFDELQLRLEESHLRYLYQKHTGDLAAIAKELGKTTRSVYRRFEKLGLKPKQLK